MSVSDISSPSWYPKQNQISISNGLRWFKNTSFELISISMWFQLASSGFNCFQLSTNVENMEKWSVETRCFWNDLVSSDFSIFSTCSRTSAPDASRRLQVYWAAAGSKSASGPRSYVWSRCTRCVARVFGDHSGFSNVSLNPLVN